jgi:hypothetical protein
MVYSREICGTQVKANKQNLLSGASITTSTEGNSYVVSLRISLSQVLDDYITCQGMALVGD